jgi:hypothetical protein
MRPALSKAFLLLAAAAAVTLGSSAGPARLEAAVVVVANRTPQSVAIAVRLTGGQAGQTTLPPGRLVSVPVADGAEITFDSGKAQRRVPLDLNSLYYFVPQEGEIALRQVSFSRTGSIPWMHVDLSGKIPPPAVVPVKILVDDEQPAVRSVWEASLRRQIETVSRIFEQFCRVRFEVVAADTWESDDGLKGFDQLGEDFRRKVSPDPARLAIGFADQVRIGHPNQVPQGDCRPLCTHLLMVGAQKNFSSSDQLVFLVHQLGHFLGAAETQDRGSVMSSSFAQDRARLLKEGVGFDPPNTLAMNLVAEEIRIRNVRSLGEIPRSTRMYLHSIYVQINPHHQSEAARYAALVDEPALVRARYVGVWADGTRAAAEGIESWHETSARPKLAGRPFWDGGPPIRWLLDNSLAPPGAPAASVEMVGGDCLPGRVTEFRTGTESDRQRLPPHLLILPGVSLDWPDGPHRDHLAIATRWVRRVVWQRVTDRYQPGTLFYRDGRRLVFRAVRLGPNSVRLLLAEGLREIPLDDLAELHFPASDPWSAHFEQLSLLTPDGSSRIAQLETSGGLRATCSLERFQARTRGGPGDANAWYHMVQPAWSLDPLWVPHREIRQRCFFTPQEVPLSRIEPAAQRQQSDLGGVWPYQVDRNVEGGTLSSGGRDYPWGLGIHARCELEFALPSCARSFRSRLGLDTLAGNGGCVLASVLLAPGGKSLYTSLPVIGSTDVFDTGPLDLPATPGEERRLLLRVDEAHQQRPQGADPLDIRDHFDWLEPLVDLDPDGLRAELARRAAGLVPAWQDWTAETPELKQSLLVNGWDENAEPRARAFRSLVNTQGVALRLTRKLQITPEKDRLLVAVSRPSRSTAARIGIYVEGKLVGQLDAPVRSHGRAPEPTIVSLAEYRGGQVTVQILAQPLDDRSLVQWDAITLVGPPAPADAPVPAGPALRDGPPSGPSK